MSLLSLILMIIFMVICVLIILMVAIQDEKQQGLSSVFGGKQGSTFGAQTANVVVKFTAVLALIFFCLALGLSLLNKRTQSVTDSTIERYKETNTVESTQDVVQDKENLTQQSSKAESSTLSTSTENSQVTEEPSASAPLNASN